MPVDLYTNPETLDFELSETGDVKTTEHVVEQDAWKRCVMPKGNFQFDESLGSLLYRVPQFGNTRASRALAIGYIKLALDDDIRAGRLQLEGEPDVLEVTKFGVRIKIPFRDLTTDTSSVLDL